MKLTNLAFHVTVFTEGQSTITFILSFLLFSLFIISAAFFASKLFRLAPPITASSISSGRLSTTSILEMAFTSLAIFIL
jgi:hypothetical protein